MPKVKKTREEKYPSSQKKYSIEVDWSALTFIVTLFPLAPSKNADSESKEEYVTIATSHQEDNVANAAVKIMMTPPAAEHAGNKFQHSSLYFRTQLLKHADYRLTIFDMNKIEKEYVAFLKECKLKDNTLMQASSSIGYSDFRHH